MKSVEKFDVPFLLSGNDVVDQHGALCGNGLMHGGASGFTNDEVVRGEQLGDFTSPAFDMDSPGKGFFE